MSDSGIEEFEIRISDAVLDDLQVRLDLSRPAPDFGNEDGRYGLPSNILDRLIRYWRERYDWRSRERMMNAFPHFRAVVADIPIHFIHVRGKGPSPVPLIMTHGWPSTFWDFHKVIGPLSDPGAYGGNPSDAFDVVVPSLPGHGFSSPLSETGINFARTADLWVELMGSLGYPKFGSQGSDWGAFVSEQLGHKFPDRVLGLHLDLQVPLDVFSAGISNSGDFTPDEAHLFERNLAFWRSETGYMQIQSTKPQTISAALNDSPVGLLAWICEKWWRWSEGKVSFFERFSEDEILDTVMLYWVTETTGTAARYYYEAAHQPWVPHHSNNPVIASPTCATLYPGEVVHQPQNWLKRYFNLHTVRQMPAGGHFPQMEAPNELVDSIRGFFRELRH